MFLQVLTMDSELHVADCLWAYNYPKNAKKIGKKKSRMKVKSSCCSWGGFTEHRKLLFVFPKVCYIKVVML